jgi:hypothetical protein
MLKTELNCENGLVLGKLMEHWASNRMDAIVLAALQFYNLQYRFSAS